MYEMSEKSTRRSLNSEIYHAADLEPDVQEAS